MLFSKNKAIAMKQATVEFTESNQTFSWSEADGFLLDFAEAKGIPALSSCRSGHCGACVVEILSGEIVYEQSVSVDLQKNEMLLCSAKPASSTIKIKL